MLVSATIGLTALRGAARRLAPRARDPRPAAAPAAASPSSTGGRAGKPPPAAQRAPRSWTAWKSAGAAAARTAGSDLPHHLARSTSGSAGVVDAPRSTRPAAPSFAAWHAHAARRSVRATSERRAATRPVGERAAVTPPVSAAMHGPRRPRAARPASAPWRGVAAAARSSSTMFGRARSRPRGRRPRRAAGSRAVSRADRLAEVVRPGASPVSRGDRPRRPGDAEVDRGVAQLGPHVLGPQRQPASRRRRRSSAREAGQREHDEGDGKPDQHAAPRDGEPAVRVAGRICSARVGAFAQSSGAARHVTGGRRRRRRVGHLGHRQVHGGVVRHGRGAVGRGGLEPHPARPGEVELRPGVQVVGAVDPGARRRAGSGRRKPMATRAGMPRVRAITAMAEANCSQ